MKKGNRRLKTLIIGLLAIFVFIVCHLLSCPAIHVAQNLKKDSQLSINTKGNSEIPSNENQARITISPSSLQVNAHVSVTQEIFLIFEILFETDASIECIDVTPLPFNKFLKILLQEIISPNAP